MKLLYALVLLSLGINIKSCEESANLPPIFQPEIFSTFDVERLQKEVYSRDEFDNSDFEEMSLNSPSPEMEIETTSSSNASDSENEKEELTQYHCDDCNYTCCSEKTLKIHLSQKHQQLLQKKIFDSIDKINFISQFAAHEIELHGLGKQIIWSCDKCKQAYFAEATLKRHSCRVKAKNHMRHRNSSSIPQCNCLMKNGSKVNFDDKSPQNIMSIKIHYVRKHSSWLEDCIKNKPNISEVNDYTQVKLENKFLSSDSIYQCNTCDALTFRKFGPKHSCKR